LDNQCLFGLAAGFDGDTVIEEQLERIGGDGNVAEAQDVGLNPDASSVLSARSYSRRASSYSAAVTRRARYVDLTSRLRTNE